MPLPHEELMVLLVTTASAAPLIEMASGPELT
jgi:hypothetical protein